MTQHDQGSVPIRFTVKEADRIYEGLRLLQIAGMRKEDPGIASYLTSDFAGGRYDAELNRSLITSFSKIRSVSGTSKRLRMTVFEIAACMLGLRWTATRLRRGEFIPPEVKRNIPLSTQMAMAMAGTLKQSLRRRTDRVRPKYLAAVNRLMQKLENSRKRAKRAFLKAHGKESYRKMEKRWNDHVRWVRVHVMDVGIRRWRSRLPGRKRLYQQRVENWVAAAREELEAENLAPPPEDELVRVVKKALRSAGRFRRTLSRRLNLAERRDLVCERVWKILNRDCLSWVRSKARQDVYDRIYRAAGLWEESDEEEPQEEKRSTRGKKKKVQHRGQSGGSQALR